MWDFLKPIIQMHPLNIHQALRRLKYLLSHFFKRTLPCVRCLWWFISFSQFFDCNQGFCPLVETFKIGCNSQWNFNYVQTSVTYKQFLWIHNNYIENFKSQKTAKQNLFFFLFFSLMSFNFLNSFPVFSNFDRNKFFSPFFIK